MTQSNLRAWISSCLVNGISRSRVRDSALLLSWMVAFGLFLREFMRPAELPLRISCVTHLSIIFYLQCVLRDLFFGVDLGSIEVMLFCLVLSPLWFRLEARLRRDINNKPTWLKVDPAI
jgi:hypothetical protein